MRTRHPFRLFALGSIALVLGTIVVSALGADEEKPAPIPVAEIKHDGPVDFEKEILPIFQANCLACHNATEAESDLVMETPQTLLKGGSEGAAVAPGESAKSLLFQSAAHRIEMVMPPEDNDVGAKPLTPQQLGLLKLWIDQGAKGEVTGLSGPAKWQTLPAGVNPIYAVAVSPDGQYAACGRANQIFVYHVPSGKELGRLTDPELLKSSLYSSPGVSHLDLVQSLAFSPDGQLLASGGYRTAKLWRRQTNRKIADLPALGQPATTLAISADGKLCAIGEAGGSIKLVDLATGKAVRSLDGHTGPIGGLAFSPDGSKLYSGSADKWLRTWNVADGAVAGQLDNSVPVTAIVLVSGATQIAAGSEDNTIRIWPLPEAPKPESPKPDGDKPAEAAQPIKELKGHSGPITSLANVDAAGTQIISGSKDGTLRHWNLADGKQIRQLNHGAPITGIAARPDGQRFVSVSANKTGKLWNAKDGKQLAEVKGDFRTQLRSEAMTRALAASKARREDRKKRVPLAEKVAKSEADAVKKATDAKAAAEKLFGEKQKALEKPTADKAVADQAVADQEVAVQKATAEKAATEKAAVDAVAALAQAKIDQQSAAKAVADAQNSVKAAGDDQAQVDAAKKAQEVASSAKGTADKALADATVANKAAGDAKKKAAQALPKQQKKQTQLEKAAKKADDAAKKAQSELASADAGKQASAKALEASNIAAKKAADKIPGVKAVLAAAEQLVKQAEAVLAEAKKTAAASEQPNRAVAFSAAGSQLAIAGDDGKIRLYDAENGGAIDTLDAHTAAISVVCFAPDGNLISTATDKSVARWNPSGLWKLERTIGSVDDASQLVDRVIAIAFSPDGKTLATGSGEPSRSGQLKLWNIADGKLVREIADAHSDTIFGLDFSPQGDYLASSAADRFMKVFRVADGAFVRAFEGHSHHVLGVAWKFDGQRIASCGADKAIKIWDFETGDQKRTISTHSKEVTAITFVGNSDEVLTSSGDKQIRLQRAENGRNVRSFGGATDFMYSVAASDDGKTVVAGGQDSVLRVWNGANGKSLYNFEPPKVDKPADGNKQVSK